MLETFLDGYYLFLLSVLDAMTDDSDSCWLSSLTLRTNRALLVNSFTTNKQIVSVWRVQEVGSG